MAYRFSDTNKWSDEWFVDLEPNQKLMFMYLCDNCDIAGFYELSLRKLSFDLGLSDVEIKGALKGLERGYILSQDKRVLFLRNFIKHQKNMPLNNQNKAHLGIINRFNNYNDRFSVNLFDIINNKNIPEIKGATKPLLRGSGIGIGTYITIKEKNKGVDFDLFWNLYDKKVGDKKKCKKKWDSIPLDTQKMILSKLPTWMSQFEEKQFQPFPETYINQERWNDEVLMASPKNNLKIINTYSQAVINHDDRA